MTTAAKPTTGPVVEADFPNGWYFRDRCVPNLYIPHELFGISNRPIPLQTDPNRSQPAVAQVDPDGVLLWSFYQALNDPPYVVPLDTLPDYSEDGLPFDYHTMRVYSPQDARGWDPSKFMWRRAGVRRSDTWITLMLFEGTSARADDIQRARGIISSFRLN